MNPTYTLSELVHIVEQWFRELFGGFRYRCQAEVLKIKQHKSRVYVDLIQYDTAWNILAKARWVIRELSVLSSFCRQTNLKIHELEGMTIMMNATCGFHHQWWFSLSIQEISAQHTLGQLKQVQQSITETLKKADLYRKNKSKTFWPPPMRVAVISSKTSEWLKDFDTVIQDSDLHIYSELYSSAVHGNAAKKEVAWALRCIQTVFDNHVWDSIPYSSVCILRGGWWADWFVRQNDLDIATLVCNMPVPVVIAIWHTSDTSILDEVAYHASKTPTDAGYFLIDMLWKWSNDVEDVYSEICDDLDARRNMYAQNSELLYTEILQFVKRKREVYKETIIYMRKSISSYAPDTMLRKWYMVAKKGDIYISVDQILELEPGTEFNLHTSKGSIGVIMK